MKKLFENSQSEAAFRYWQAKHKTTLETVWPVSIQKVNGISFDKFCLDVYTGRVGNLILN